MFTWLRKVRDVVGWLKLPEDIRGLWKVFWEYVLRPILPGGFVGAIAYLQNASLWVIGLWVFGMYVIVLAFGGRLIEGLRRLAPAQQADGQANLPTASQTSESETQELWREQDALEAYRNQMEQWLHDQSKPLRSLPPDHEIRISAQDYTLTILERLGPNGKRNVLRFIHSHRLIEDGNAVISMDGADLSGANLSRMRLTDADLVGANLRGTDLSYVETSGFLHGSDGRALRAIERGGEIMDLAEPTRTSSLVRADFTDVVLKHARLMHCNLQNANLAGADLDRADLRGTDLRWTHNLAQEQIGRAYGSSGRQECMIDTLLPDHLHAPETWERLISQQVQEREQSQGSGES